MNSFRLNPYWLTITAALLAGGNSVLARYLQLSALNATFARVSVPAGLLLIYLKLNKDKIIKPPNRMMMLASFFNAIRMPLFYWSFLYTTVANGMIIVYTWPIFAAIGGLFFLKEKLDLKAIILIFLSFIGVIIMYFDQSNWLISLSNLWGMSIMLLHAILFAITMLIFKNQSKHFSIAESIFYQNIVAAVVFLPFILVGGWTIAFVPTIISFSFFGLITGVILFILFFYSLKRLKISHYSLLTYLEVPSSIVMAVLFLGEKISYNTLLGGILVIGSSILISVHRPVQLKTSQTA